MVVDIKAVIFDLDGVITDTAEYHFLSWKRLAEEEGIEFSREDNDKFRGISRRDCLEILLKDRVLSEEEKDKLADRKNIYYREYLKDLDESNILPGVEQLINYLRKKNYKLAVASSSKNTLRVLDRLGITDVFDAIADGNSVENSKPAPDIFLYTAKQLEVNPEGCIVIEDSASGIEAANKAGMLTIGIGPEERVGEADYYCRSVSDIEIENIIN